MKERVKRKRLVDWCEVLLRVGLGLVFVYAGVGKVLAPMDFADSVASFQLLPEVLVMPVALDLPVYEVMLGGLLAAGVWRWEAVLGIVILCGVFAVALGQALVRGLDVDCGCFGGGGVMSGGPWWALGRDAVLMAAGFWLLSRWGRRSDLSGGGATAGLADQIPEEMSR